MRNITEAKYYFNWKQYLLQDMQQNWNPQSQTMVYYIQYTLEIIEQNIPYLLSCEIMPGFLQCFMQYPQLLLNKTTHDAIVSMDTATMDALITDITKKIAGQVTFDVIFEESKQLYFASNQYLFNEKKTVEYEMEIQPSAFFKTWFNTLPNDKLQHQSPVFGKYLKTYQIPHALAQDEMITVAKTRDSFLLFNGRNWHAATEALRDMLLKQLTTYIASDAYKALFLQKWQEDLAAYPKYMRENGIFFDLHTEDGETRIDGFQMVYNAANNKACLVITYKNEKEASSIAKKIPADCAYILQRENQIIIPPANKAAKIHGMHVRSVNLGISFPNKKRKTQLSTLLQLTNFFSNTPTSDETTLFYTGNISQFLISTTIEVISRHTLHVNYIANPYVDCVETILKNEGNTYSLAMQMSALQAMITNKDEQFDKKEFFGSQALHNALKIKLGPNAIRFIDHKARQYKKDIMSFIEFSINDECKDAGVPENVPVTGTVNNPLLSEALPETQQNPLPQPDGVPPVPYSDSAAPTQATRVPEVVPVTTTVNNPLLFKPLPETQQNPLLQPDGVPPVPYSDSPAPTQATREPEVVPVTTTANNPFLFEPLPETQQNPLLQPDGVPPIPYSNYPVFPPYPAMVQTNPYSTVPCTTNPYDILQGVMQPQFNHLGIPIIGPYLPDQTMPYNPANPGSQQPLVITHQTVQQIFNPYTNMMDVTETNVYAPSNPSQTPVLFEVPQIPKTIAQPQETTDDLDDWEYMDMHNTKTHLSTLGIFAALPDEKTFIDTAYHCIHKLKLSSKTETMRANSLLYILRSETVSNGCKLLVLDALIKEGVGGVLSARKGKDVVAALRAQFQTIDECRFITITACQYAEHKCINVLETQRAILDKLIDPKGHEILSCNGLYDCDVLPKKEISLMKSLFGY